MSLNCTDLMAVIFQILNKQIYECFHAVYMNILVNHVLANKIYRMEINSEQWSKILTLSMKIYRNSTDYFKSVVLNTARLAVQYGCLQSHLVFEVKKILPFLGNNKNPSSRGHLVGKSLIEWFFELMFYL